MSKSGAGEYGEPWTLDDLESYSHRTNLQRQRRTLACVNALAGIEHPEAVPQVIEAARAIIATLGPDGYFPTCGEPKTRALRAALAALGGAK